MNRFSLNVKKGANPFGLGKPISAETFQEVLRFTGFLASKAAFQHAEFRVTAHFCCRQLPFGGVQPLGFSNFSKRSGGIKTCFDFLWGNWGGYLFIL
ncbi:hypothetical protein GNG26_15260 [Leclercia sp. J807]|uniref:hypothetical protein n=1 Tax=Leclercia sp. J807 TaxID=2681307 RepID=UPI0012E2773B|nr:hypothetical protein [Leclercia sp. J807]QGU11622.1 hypothetical protein GNG26_15260 [Leclercia sp. J807]